MEYVTTNEMARKWGITRRRITKLCKDGRVEGAVLMGYTWIIPKNTPKPDEKKRGPKSQFQEETLTKDVFNLSYYDEYREGNRLELKNVKEELPCSLWETYSSFSNCNGGVIILGVKEREDGSWYTTHLQNESKLLKDFWDAINNHNKVSVNLLNEENVETYEVDGDVIIVIYVPKADRVYKPVYINGNLFSGTFRRDHEGDYRCTEDEVRGMLRDQAVKGMDNKIVLGMDLDVFYPETVKSFRTRHKAVNPDHVWHKLEDNAYLERIGAAAISDVDGKLHPTVAGLLMFGEEYKIRYEFADYFLDYREMLDPSIRWTDRLESSSGEWSGNMLDFFFQMERKLLRDIKRPFKLEGITRIDETPIHKAIREALANCFANADFNFARGIVILKDPYSIVIENPGSIITGKAQMLKGGISEPRNRTIMKMFNLLHIGKGAGSGVPEIFSVWDEEGWIAPTVEEEYNPDRTRLTLAFKEKQAERGTKQAEKEVKQAERGTKQAERGTKQAENKIVKRNTDDKKALILSHIKREGHAKSSDIAEVLGLSLPRVRVLLSEMTNDGLIKPEGEGRSRVYKP